MKNKHESFDWLRLAILALLLLNLIYLAGQSANAAPLGYGHSDRWLLDQARYYISKDDGLMAAEYLRAFLEREPDLLKNSTSWSNYVKTKLSKIESTVKLQVRYGKDVQADLEECGRYDCENAQFRAMQSTEDESVRNIYLAPLPDEAIFYDGQNCTGKFVTKSVGTYNNDQEIGLRNDTITGFWLGGNVTVTLCMHGGMTGDCATFTESNCDITQHWLGYQVTSVSVNLR